jgi:hypothetical protein
MPMDQNVNKTTNPRHEQDEPNPIKLITAPDDVNNANDL